MKKTVKGAIGVIAAAGLVAGGYFGYGVLGTKAGKVVNEVQSKVKQTVNSKDKKGQKNNTKNMNYSGWYINRISTYLPFINLVMNLRMMYYKKYIYLQWITTVHIGTT